MKAMTSLLLILLLAACNLAAPPVETVLSPEPDNELLVYWLPSDNPVNDDSIAIGCGIYITPIETRESRMSNPNDNIVTVLEIMLTTTAQAPYRNWWNGFGLSVGSVTSDTNDLITVTIEGDFLLAGTCGDAEIIAQILLIVFAEPEVLSARIIVNDMNLKQISDMSGQSSADSVFTRDDIPVID